MRTRKRPAFHASTIRAGRSRMTGDQPTSPDHRVEDDARCISIHAAVDSARVAGRNHSVSARLRWRPFSRRARPLERRRDVFFRSVAKAGLEAGLNRGQLRGWNVRNTY